MGVPPLSGGGPGLGGATWTDCAERGGALLAVPLGSCEQHGPHLPLDTDTRIAAEVAHRWAERRTDVMVAPALAYGASGEHAEFAGTLSIGTAALTEVLVELGRSADHFGGIVWVCGHGGNVEALTLAVGRLAAEGRPSVVFRCGVPGGDAHAGHTETSVMTAIDAGAVRIDRLEAGCLQPWEQIGERVRRSGVVSVSANGVLGDPRRADAGSGEAILGEMVDRLDAAVTAWTDEHS